MKKILFILIGLLIIITTSYIVVTEKSNKSLVIAHRGASGYAPEHTFKAYDIAVENKDVDYLELDLHLTKDNYLVSIHDDTVDRTTNGHGKVNDLTIKEIKQLEAGSWFDKKYKNEKVPTLNEVLDRYGNKTKYYIEIKEIGKKKLIDEFLYQLKLNGFLSEDAIDAEKVIIQTFSSEDLKYIKEKNHHIKLVQLVNKGFLTNCTDNNLQEIKKYADVIGPDFRELTYNNVKKLHENNLEVHAYTINNKSDKEFAKSVNVDGYFTNFPD